MSAEQRYMEGTTVGSGRDIIGVRRDQIPDMVEKGRALIARGKEQHLLPDTITGATAALMVTIAGFEGALTEGQWRELAGVIGGIMREPEFPDLSKLRTLIAIEQFQNVARNAGYSKFIRRLDDGRWVCALAPARAEEPAEDT